MPHGRLRRCTGIFSAIALVLAILLMAGREAKATASWEVGPLRTHGTKTLASTAEPNWSLTGSMTTARDFHTATLLANGKVLVAGGYDGHYLSSAEVYDSSSGTWSVIKSMTTTRWGQTATLLPNGNVLVAGGYGPSYVSSAELYIGQTTSKVYLPLVEAGH